jgi:hypothetical protein
MDYVNVLMAALNEVSAATWLQWTQGSAILGCVGVTAILTWVVKDLWARSEWLDYEQDMSRAVQLGIQDRINDLESRVNRHEAMLAHMQRMREAKAAKKAKKAA